MSTPAPADPSVQSDPDSAATSNAAAPAKIDLARLGNTAQCPICGSDVHKDAYHCTKCRSFFCYHCRAHLSVDEPILQCCNQDCGYYGKWVCSVCNSASKKDESPLEYLEPIDGYWPAWFLVSLLLSLLWGWRFTWISALLLFLGLYVGLGYILHKMEVNIFGKQRKVSMARASDFHACICCKNPTKKTGLRHRAG